MVIAERVNRVAFYCRMNHRDHDYTQFLDDVKKRLERAYGKQEWELKIYFEEASGADPDRKEFNRLKQDISQDQIDVVVSVRAAMIARDWGQFMEFMEICEKAQVEVLCLDEVEDAGRIFQRIQKFIEAYFEGSEENMRIRIITAVPTAEKKKRVCAYARVSTDSRRQEESLENQTATYERLIRSNPEYAFAGVYADQGISGYCENRPQFQKMLERARAGEIDLIITKSISRFARNTVTVLKVARELKELGVGIFFEEQNINTLSGDGEMMLAVLASFAQEESRSMSENNKWSIKKKFERGEVVITTSRFCGYDKNEYGDLVVNGKEAEIVRLSFDPLSDGRRKYQNCESAGLSWSSYSDRGNLGRRDYWRNDCQ